MKKITIIFVLMLFPLSIAHAFLPLLMAGLDYAAPIALRTAITRGVGALTIEAAERQVIANATKVALNRSVARLATGSPNPTKFQLISGAATWATLGEVLLDIGDEIFGVDQNAGVSSGSTADNGRQYYIGAGSGGTAPYYSGDYPENLLYSAYRYQSSNGILPCSSSAGCTYSTSITVQSSSTTTNGNITYSVGYQSSYATTSGTILTVDRTVSYTVRINTSYDSAIAPQTADITAEQEQKIISTPLDAQRMADAMNALLLDAASQPDYDGLPISSSSPLVTAQDVLEAAASVGRPNPTQAEWASPWQDLETSTEPGTDTGTEPGTDTGTGGGSETATPPTLDNPPDGKTILAPILEMFSEWDDFSIGSRAASCPIAEFELWDKNFVIDSHCQLIENNREVIKIVFLIFWGFAAFRRVMSA